MTGKLYGTLGPACADTDTLRALLRAGMRGVRLNLSHGPLAERAPWLESLRRAETAEGVSCDLLIDLQGPELRVGALFAPLTLREGDTLTLDPDRKSARRRRTAARRRRALPARSGRAGDDLPRGARRGAPIPQEPCRRGP